jgi:hypothetical protein
MKEIDEFLHFLLEHESDERISFSKKMKYGYRYYYVNFNIDEKPEKDENKNPQIQIPFDRENYINSENN